MAAGSARLDTWTLPARPGMRRELRYVWYQARRDCGSSPARRSCVSIVLAALVRLGRRFGGYRRDVDPGLPVGEPLVRNGRRGDGRVLPSDRGPPDRPVHRPGLDGDRPHGWHPARRVGRVLRRHSGDRVDGQREGAARLRRGPGVPGVHSGPGPGGGDGRQSAECRRGAGHLAGPRVPPVDAGRRPRQPVPPVRGRRPLCRRPGVVGGVAPHPPELPGPRPGGELGGGGPGNSHHRRPELRGRGGAHSPGRVGAHDLAGREVYDPRPLVAIGLPGPCAGHDRCWLRPGGRRVRTYLDPTTRH